MNSTNIDNIVSLMNRVTELEEALDRQDLVAADAWSENEKLEAENERLKDQVSALTVVRDHNADSIFDLAQENERLRKELASYRKGDCRRKIDKAMEGK